MLHPNGHWYSARPVRVLTGLELKLAVDLGFETWTRRIFRLYGLGYTQGADAVSTQHALTQLVSSVRRPEGDRPPAPPPLFIQSISRPGNCYQVLLFDTLTHRFQDLLEAEQGDDLFGLSLNQVLLETRPEMFRTVNPQDTVH